MDDPGSGQGREGQQDAVAEVPHQGSVETLEPVLLDQLVQVERHQLEDDAGVVPEHEAVLHVDHVGAALGILHQKMLQDLELSARLLLELLVVPDHLKRCELLLLVVEDLEDLSEGALAEHPEHLVPVGDLVMGDVVVRPLGVVEAEVGGEGVGARDLAPGLSRLLANEVDLLVGEDLGLFERTENGRAELEKLS